MEKVVRTEYDSSQKRKVVIYMEYPKAIMSRKELIEMGFFPALPEPGSQHEGSDLRISIKS